MSGIPGLTGQMCSGENIDLKKEQQSLSCFSKLQVDAKIPNLQVDMGEDTWLPTHTYKV